jgi:hypothetical protein
MSALVLWPVLHTYLLLINICFSLTPISTLNAIENFGKHALDISQSMSSLDNGPSSHQAMDKYRYPLEVHLSAIAKIPHSQPSVRSMKKNTLFPSLCDDYQPHDQKDVESSIAKRNSSKEDSSYEEDEKATTSLKEDLRRLNMLDKLDTLNKRGEWSLSSSPPSPFSSLMYFPYLPCNASRWERNPQ